MGRLRTVTVPHQGAARQVGPRPARARQEGKMRETGSGARNKWNAGARSMRSKSSEHHYATAGLNSTSISVISIDRI
jgi:hypothetical protein